MQNSANFIYIVNKRRLPLAARAWLAQMLHWDDFVRRKKQ